MTDLNLEVGKSYVTNLYDKEDPTDGAIVRIGGLVLPETREYKLGYRFFGTNGIPYTEKGVSYGIRIDPDVDPVIATFNAGYDPDKGNIIAPAFTHHLKQSYEEHAWIDPNTCPNHPHLYHHSVKGFAVQLLGLYVDRMGCWRFIDKVNHFTDTEIWGPDGGMRFMSNGVGYEDNGQEDKARPSMWDLVYQYRFSV